MNSLLSVSDVKILIKKAEDCFRHEECANCECYLGYVAELQLDSDFEAQQYLKACQPPREEIHACLGCDPCAPGILYTDYLRKKASLLKMSGSH
jgi:hypothetical protein